MARTQSISLDVGGHDVVAHFGGVEEVSQRRRQHCVQQAKHWAATTLHPWAQVLQGVGT